MASDVDVVVVGAGPAGCAAATSLARRGRTVLLLDRSPIPREKACGDGLTRASLAQLDLLGCRPELAPFQSVRGTRLSFASGAEFTRATPGGRGRVVPRAVLDALLADRARSAGVTVAPSCRATGLLREAGRTVGVRYVDGADDRQVTSRFVVAADGATSALARAGGLARPTDRTGFAVRAYVGGLRGLTDEFRVLVPLVDPATGRTLPGYGWVFPVSADVANVGVGCLRIRPQDAGVNLRTVFRDFLGTLESDGSPRPGPLRGAPLPCDFDPERCSAGALVLVGDAARLVDPLSGEGIDTALESGALAADMIERALAAGRYEVPGYGAELRRRFGRRMDAAWSLVEHHEFVWNVVSGAASVERPLHRGARRAVSAYDRGAPEPAEAEGPAALRLWLARHGLLDEVRAARRAVREEAGDELPLLAGAVTELRDAMAEQTRIASLLVCAGILAAPARRRDARRLAVASELACLALAAHEDVLDALPDGGPRAANLFAVSAGDALLCRSLERAADVGAWAVRLMSRASADVCAGTLLGGPGAVALTTGTVFALPVRLGAHLAHADPATVTRLTAEGRSLGTTWASWEGSRRSDTPEEPGTAAEERRARCAVRALDRLTRMSLPRSGPAPAGRLAA
ncbi:geranylgeranyl reductase family protein [Streptomyces sp. R302]|uniref:geranylgeranyl reductase family protein n=1 Tax=unclassified Streptomyces TaxID=2593676 RepID=UPI00145EA9E9|nr:MULTISPECIES: geranylgeranyl reductase family protein [unclassified Streptomyces]NML52519.1 geranylgeranyl reductase family protein [Streptomyces sp. R301]NML80552.1 geranylgeranyl reductase family protein [Streptomyces sp. R302]